MCGREASENRLPQSCFVITPFEPPFDGLYLNAVAPAIQSCGYRAERGDGATRAGNPFTSHILETIRSPNCAFCVVDLTGLNSNVLMELGAVLAEDKEWIPITQDPTTLPSNVRHLSAVCYNPGDPRGLEEQLGQRIKQTQTYREATVLREMIAPRSLDLKSDVPFYVVASPLSYREATRRDGGFKQLVPTHGDHVGVRGLIQAFGAVFGMSRLPELVDPGDFELKRRGGRARDQSAHLYCIGSPKSNEWTGKMLDLLGAQKAPAVRFVADRGSENLRNVHLDVEILASDGTELDLRLPAAPSQDRTKWDFGLIVRVPRPQREEEMLTVLAGRSSLGTAAASLAATTPEHLIELQDQLKKQGVRLSQHTQGFLAVVHIEYDAASARRVPDARTLKLSSVCPIRAKAP